MQISNREHFFLVLGFWRKYVHVILEYVLDILLLNFIWLELSCLQRRSQDDGCTAGDEEYKCGRSCT